MPIYKVNVKWQREKFCDLECDTDDSPEVFKALLFSVTGVPPERQKVMMPGKILGDQDYEGIKLRNGANIMLIGTNDELQSTKREVDEQHHEEHHVPEPIKLPYGLTNLGNTCYMNATVQMLRSIPELVLSMDISNIPLSETLCESLKLLFRSLKNADQPVVPAFFLFCLHKACPQFATPAASDPNQSAAAQLLSGTKFQQQDANECWTELIRAVQKATVDPKLLSAYSNPPAFLGSTAGWNPVDRFLTGKLSSTLKCTESEEETISESSEAFSQLSCFINTEVKYLHTGLRNSFECTLTKHSNLLNRDALYDKISRISRLPGYLSLQFVRFFYKEDKQINAKILKDVKFPLSLDLYEFCTPELQQRLLPMREKIRAQEDYMAEKGLRRVDGRVRDESVNAPDPYEHPELYEPYWLSDDLGSNNTGYYELQGVLTHQGRTSSSGHYVAWIKMKGMWLKFDDEDVNQVTSEEILRLSGGGDWHCAYVLLYSPRRILVNLPGMASPLASTTPSVNPVTAESVHGDQPGKGTKSP